jgi:hypothetical protein
MFDLIEKFLSVYLAWLWFQVIVILVGVGGLFLFAAWLSS